MTSNLIESASKEKLNYSNVVFDRHFGQVFVKIIETEAHEMCMISLRVGSKFNVKY